MRAFEEWSGPCPLPEVRERLTADRRAGRPFEEAWADALKAIRSVADRRLVARTADGWRSAYQGDPPTDAERAARGLAALLGNDERDDAMLAA